jgi:hypothetical protein
MFRPHIGSCSNKPNCNRTNVPIMVKDGFCNRCHHERKQAKRKLAGKNPSKSFQSYSKHKPSGELALFKTLLEVRGAKSQISGEKLVGFDIRWFSHILSKGAYPSFKLFDKNIVLKTPREHELWETQRHKLKNLPEWQWVFNLEQELKELYHKKITNPVTK